MTEAGASPRRGRPFLDWKALAGFAISIGLLYYAFRGIDPGEVLRRMGDADPVLLLLAAVLATLVFPVRALRWKVLLEPVNPRSAFRPRFAATCIGFMANNLLPARVGEFARAYALSRLERIRVSASFGSLVVERMFDGVVVVGMLMAALAMPGFPEVSDRDFSGIAVGVGAIFAVLFVLLLLMVARPERSVRAIERSIVRLLPKRARRPVIGALEAFLTGVAAVRDWRLVARTLAWSIGLWLLGAAGFQAGFAAFGIDVPFLGAVFLQSLIALAVALPSAPGFFGVFEAGARVGLVDVWGVETSDALAFALGFHLAGYIPVTAMGLYYAWRLGLSWREVEQSEDAVETAVEVGAGATAPAERGAGPG